MGVRVNNDPTLRAGLEDKGESIITVYPRLSHIMCYLLQPDWSLLLLVNIQGSLHCKQGSLQDTSQ